MEKSNVYLWQFVFAGVASLVCRYDKSGSVHFFFLPGICRACKHNLSSSRLHRFVRFLTVPPLEKVFKHYWNTNTLISFFFQLTPRYLFFIDIYTTTISLYYYCHNIAKYDRDIYDWLQSLDGLAAGTYYVRTVDF